MSIKLLTVSSIKDEDDLLEEINVSQIYLQGLMKFPGDDFPSVLSSPLKDEDKS